MNETHKMKISALTALIAVLSILAISAVRAGGNGAANGGDLRGGANAGVHTDAGNGGANGGDVHK